MTSRHTQVLAPAGTCAHITHMCTCTDSREGERERGERENYATVGKLGYCLSVLISNIYAMTRDYDGTYILASARLICIEHSRVISKFEYILF